MSLRHESLAVVVCDGCGKEHLPEGATEAFESRVQAYNAGWRFPPMLKRGDGSTAHRTNDVCPDCFPEWAPRTMPSRPRSRPPRSHEGQHTTEAWPEE